LVDLAKGTQTDIKRQLKIVNAAQVDPNLCKERRQVQRTKRT